MEDNPLPSVHGRVCHHPCETSCNRGALDSAVRIHAVERFLGDRAAEDGAIWPGGICTHWKTPPYHGAPSFLPLDAATQRWLLSVSKLKTCFRRKCLAATLSRYSSALDMPVWRVSPPIS
jgi:hypothetical protein